MSRDEFIGKLNMLYAGDKNCLEELLTTYDELLKENVSLNNQLEFIGEQNKYIDKLEYKIKKLVYSCYESDMSYEEFKAIWVNAFGKLYDPKDIDKLENELKGDNK